jgi:hypothetical protein
MRISCLAAQRSRSYGRSSVLGTEKWLARFYDTVTVLHQFLGKTLDDFLGKQGANMATELVKTLNEGVLSAVKSKIAAFQKVFDAKPASDKKPLLDAALSIFAHPSHNQYTCKCPACGGAGQIDGGAPDAFHEERID